VEPSEALEFFLSAEHWLDAFTSPLETHLDRLARSVKEYLLEQVLRGAEGTTMTTITPPVMKRTQMKFDERSC
jgi:hypothetical protein